MSKYGVILFSALFLLLQSCSEEVSKPVNPMLATVPSDAIAVVTGDHLETVLQNLQDSTHVLRKIVYGPLLKNDAALSFCYTSSLTPVLTIDASKQASDSLEALRSIMDSAAALKLSAKLTDGILAISQSETLTASVERHINEGGSILDAPYFSEILSLADGGHDCVFLKNSGALRWLPKNALTPLFTNREAVSFIRSLARWTVILQPGSDGGEIRFAGSDSPSCYSRILRSAGNGRMKIQDVIPSDAEFVLAENVESEQFRTLFEEFLDAGIKLDRYQRNFDAVKRACGKYPPDAEKEMDVKEVALLQWEGRKVALLRCGSSVRDTLVAENQFPGIIPALYGSAFRSEDGWTCRRGFWRAFGSREDVEAFAALPPVEDAPDANAFYFKAGGTTIFEDNRGTILWK